MTAKLSAERANLVLAHLDVAKKRARIMHKRLGGRFRLDDLEAEARFGLLQAALVWDGRGTFGGFSILRVDGAMLDLVRVEAQPRRRTPSIRTDIDVAELPLPRHRATPEAIINLDAAIVLRAAATAVTTQQWEVLRMRHTEGLSQDDVGKRFGVTGVRIHQIEKEAHARINEALKRLPAFGEELP